MNQPSGNTTPWQLVKKNTHHQPLQIKTRYLKPILVPKGNISTTQNVQKVPRPLPIFIHSVTDSTNE